MRPDRQILDHQFGITFQRNVRDDDLGEFSGVDVAVNFHGIGTEFRQIAGDAVIPTGANGKDQVAVLHSAVGVGGAVHPQHAQVPRMAFIAGALPSRVLTMGIFRRSASLVMASPAPDHGPIANVEEWALGLLQGSGAGLSGCHDRRGRGHNSREDPLHRRTGRRKGLG